MDVKSRPAANDAISVRASGKRIARAGNRWKLMSSIAIVLLLLVVPKLSFASSNYYHGMKVGWYDFFDSYTSSSALPVVQHACHSYLAVYAHTRIKPGSLVVFAWRQSWRNSSGIHYNPPLEEAWGLCQAHYRSSLGVGWWCWRYLQCNGPFDHWVGPGYNEIYAWYNGPCQNFSPTDGSCETNKVKKGKTLGRQKKKKCPCSVEKAKHQIPTQKGQPIQLYTGNVYHSQTDYEGGGVFPLAFKRYYNSQNIDPGHVGANWRDSYDGQIKLASSGTEADVVRPDGRVLQFKDNGGTWQGDADVMGRLSRTSTGWTYNTGRNTVERYNASGALQSITRRGGYTQTMGYDSAGHLTSVTGPFGRQLTLSYDSASRVASVTDPQGDTYSYSYDSTGNLTEVTYPDGSTRQYVYEDSSFPHALTGIIDADGNRYLTWTYDSQGRATSDALAGGADKIAVQYNSDGTTTVTDALGHQRTYHFIFENGSVQASSVDGGFCASCANATTSETFDANGYLASTTDANGNKTTYVNDARGLETSRTEAVGTPQQRTITTQWETNVNLPVKVTEPGKSTAFTWDAKGHLLTRTVTDTKTGNSRTWTYTYNAQGLLASVNGPRTDVSDITQYAYDSQGNLTSVTDALGHTTQITSYDADGRPLTLVGPNGLTTQLSYDARGRLVSRNVGGEVTSFAYDAAGNLTRITLPDGRYLAYTYDAAHRLVGITDQLGDGINYTLDAAGNRTQENIDDPSGNLTYTRSHVYNDLGQLLKDVGAAGQTTTYAYDGDGNRINTDDALNNSTTRAFDALNRLTTVTDSLNGVTRYGYDGQDNLVSVTDPDGNTTTYAYDGFGDKTSVTSPDTGTTTYTYDNAGNVVSKTDAKGQTTTYTYDALNRLTQATYADGTTTTYTYDTAPNGIGRLASMTDSTGTTSWSYDQHGRITNVRRDFNGVVLSTSYSYDASGRLIGMTYPSGTQVSYAYSNGQLSSVDVNGQPLMTGITYQPFGPVQSWTWGNGTTASRSYDLNGWLTALSLGNDKRTLSYDALGDITSIDDSLANRTYGYDALMRLTSATDGSQSWDYAYDPNGNRTSLTDASGTTSYSYASGSNQLDSLSGASNASYQYDADGNVVSDGTHTYQYDARNRLVGVDNAVSFALNGMGQRVEKRSSKSATLYLYGLNGQLIARTDPVGRTEREYIYVNGVPAAVLVYRSVGNTAQAGTGIANRSANASNTPASTKGNTPTVAGHGGSKVLPQSPTGLYYIHTDHLGTPRVITDPSTGQVVWRWDGEPFGASAPNEDPNGSGSNFVFNLRFPGQYYDAETGLDYNYYRDYDPRTGRYVESDPTGLWGGLNTYGYVYGNPLILLDLYGLQIYRYPGSYYTDQYQGPGAMVPVTIGDYIIGWKPYSPQADEAASWPSCVEEYPYPTGGSQDKNGTDNNKTAAKGGALPWWHVFGPTGNSAADLASDQCSLGALLGFGGEQGLHRGAEEILGDGPLLKALGFVGLARQAEEQVECAEIKLNPSKYGY